jgi:hypothetical protein
MYRAVEARIASVGSPGWDRLDEGLAKGRPGGRANSGPSQGCPRMPNDTQGCASVEYECGPGRAIERLVKIVDWIGESQGFANGPRVAATLSCLFAKRKHGSADPSGELHNFSLAYGGGSPCRSVGGGCARDRERERVCEGGRGAGA